MRKRTWPMVAVAVFGLVSVLSVGTAGADLEAFESRLAGSEEVPGPGDPDGSGKGNFELDGRDLCFALKWRNIGRPTGAHIHLGDPGEAGPIVVDLLSGERVPQGVRRVERCMRVSARVARAIASYPREFYVNIHTAAFPDGAIRGQLERD